jgi:hypothetical protein
MADVDGQGWAGLGRASDMVALFADTWHRVLEVKEAGVGAFSANELATIAASMTPSSPPVMWPTRR